MLTKKLPFLVSLRYCLLILVVMLIGVCAMVFLSPVEAYADTIPTQATTATISSPASCVVITYRVIAQWPGGFTTFITITNECTTAISLWTLQFTFPGNQQIAQDWGGLWSQSGQQVAVTGEGYNAVIPAGGSVTLGFSAIGNPCIITTFIFNGSPTS
ncbi:MAG TPA: cellulose binding domain-containing protein [Ktedonobacteraceae bacterium]|jgi:cellulase/cellobiase CelA1|nr:cellulose binding domain-containing protein [Ktedonobacteraceae bacterium]